MSELWDKAKELAKEVADEAAELGDTIGQKVGEALEAGKDVAGDVVASAKELLESGSASAERQSTSLADGAREAVKTAEDAISTVLKPPAE